MKTAIEMAGEVLDRMAPDDHCRKPYWTATDEELERLVELVREETNARANASWTLMCEKMVAIEREVCANIAHQWSKREDDVGGYIEAAIRARSNT